MKRTRLIWAACGIACAAAALFWPVDVSRAALSPSLLASNGELLRAYPAPDHQIRLPLETNDVDPVFINMLLAYEDQRFHFHPGIDPAALTRAFYQWMETGKIISGGSTITMQVARLLKPAPRTVLNKLLEIWRALRLEAQYSKTDILNFYLVLAPYGGNLSGLRAGSYAYFGKEPKHLTPDEAALLVVLPQNPNLFRPDRFPERARTARAKILRRLADKNIISATAAETGINAPIPQKRFTMPVVAPQLADSLAAQKILPPWRSTIDAELQKKLEAVLQQKLETLGPHATIAALVVNNRTHQVIGYVGNADYFSVARAGHIDLVRAMRSPGSTLKPFVYGMAFQDGLAAPETIIRDTPTRFGTYTPSNFNQGYQGDISLRAALQQSLNIPAVKIISEVGAERWLGKLRSTGVRIELPRGTTSAELPIVLGGLGTRLWDLVQIYSALANDGNVYDLLLQTNEKVLTPRPLLSKTAAWQVTNILTGSPLSEGVMRPADLGQLAVKTGTSYGYRDAWGIGYTPDYTVGIWVGRADGSPSPGQVGRNTAVPILLSVYDLLPLRSQWKSAPSNADIANNKLPPSQKRWLGERNLTVRNSNPLGIVYPVDGSHFLLHEIQADGLKFTAQGGKKPYHWYVNGNPLLANDNNFETRWHPGAPGRYKITLQDEAGQLLTSYLHVSE